MGEPLKPRIADESIVDFEGLARALGTPPNTLKKRWRRIPHFFIGRGETRKGARFLLNEVLAYLKAESYDHLAGSKNAQIPGKVRVQGGALREEGVSDQGERPQVGNRGKRRARKSKTPGDPYNLFGDRRPLS